MSTPMLRKILLMATGLGSMLARITQLVLFIRKSPYFPKNVTADGFPSVQLFVPKETTPQTSNFDVFLLGSKKGPPESPEHVLIFRLLVDDNVKQTLYFDDIDLNVVTPVLNGITFWLASCRLLDIGAAIKNISKF